MKSVCILLVNSHLLLTGSPGMTVPPSSGSVAGGGAVDGTLSPEVASLTGLASHDPLLVPTSVNLLAGFSPLDGTGGPAPQNGTGSTNLTALGGELTTPGTPSLLDLVNMISSGVQVAAADTSTTNTPTSLLGGGGGAANSIGAAVEPNFLYSIFGNLGTATTISSLSSTTAAPPSGGMMGGLLGASSPTPSPAPGSANPNILADLIKSINPVNPTPGRRPEASQSKMMQQMMMLMMMLREGAIEL